MRYTTVRRTPWTARILGLLAGSLLTACADGPTTLPEDTAASASSPALAQELDSVAAALASALRQDEMRELVKQALRASPYTEHKLELQTFVQTPEGRRFLAEAATSAGMGLDTLDETLGRLPTLDFYMPSREDRRSWTGGANVVLAASLGRITNGARGYAAGGSAVTVDTELLQSGAAVLLLHPAEPKGLRMDPQPAGKGSVIQDEVDGEMGVTYEDRMPDGRILKTHLRSKAQLEHSRLAVHRGSLGDVGSGGVESMVEPGRTYARNLVTAYACDYFCAVPLTDALELEFKTWINGVEKKTYFYGVPPTASYANIPIRDQQPSFGETIYIQVWESDNGGDDRYISLGLTRSQFPTPMYGGGNIRCNTGDPTFDCTFYIWHEVNASFALGN